MPDERDETLELLRRWYAGDRTALEALLAVHLDDLHAYVRSRLRDELRALSREHDSLDLVQTAALRVLSYTPAFIPVNGRMFHRLLRKFVLNDVTSRLRSPGNARREGSRERFGDSVLDLRADSHASQQPDVQAQNAEQRQLMRAWARMALEFLEDESDRRLLLMAAVEELPWKEIGKELGLAPHTARMRYDRLLPRLATYIRSLQQGRVDDLFGEDE